MGTADQAPQATGAAIGDIADPGLRRLFDYWERKRGRRRWPARADIDPLDLRDLLGSIVIVDVVPGDAGAPPRFRYRLFGTKIVERVGFEMTGKFIDEWADPEYRDYLNWSYAEVYHAARPFRRLRRLVKDDRIMNYESLMLPLGPADRIEQILACQIFEG
ncbi:MAG: PAS domain-containing protein [Alphaproteobacteria bacterium]|nr:PAS domain-containing protein [Alphaproteobacteria bacterium]